MNTRPIISDLAHQTISEDSTTGPIGFTVGDAETAATSLILSASSSNPALASGGNIAFGGSGANRTINVTPTPNQSGSVTITVTVTDESGGTASDSFLLTVEPVNDAPTVSSLSDRTTNKDQPTPDLLFTVGDAETAVSSLLVSGSSSNPVLVPDGNIVFGGSGSNRTVRVTPATGQVGSAMITVTVGDGQLSVSESFELRVLAVTVPTAGLISHWKLDETAGGMAADSAGSNHGAWVNGPLPAEGLIGGALSFDGLNDVVNVPDSNSLDLTANFTLSLWFKPAQNINAFTPRKDLFKKYTAYWLIFNYPWNDGKLVFALNSGAPLLKTTTSSWVPGQWYHVVASYDGAAMKIYVNGVLEGTAATSVAVSPNAYPVQIGGNTEQHSYFPGAVDEVRIYGRAVSASEAQALYEEGGTASSVQALDSSGAALGSASRAKVAAPDSALRVWLTAAGSKAILSWNAVVGKTYRVEFKEHLMDNWTPLPGDVQAEEPVATKDDFIGPAQRFYRVQLLP
jgi:hypothetical protein